MLWELIFLIILAVSAALIAAQWRARGTATRLERAYACVASLPLLLTLSPAIPLMVGGETAVAGWAGPVSRVGIGLSALLLAGGVAILARRRSPLVFVSAALAALPAALTLFWAMVWR